MKCASGKGAGKRAACASCAGLERGPRTECAQKTAAPLCRSAAAGMSNAMAYKSDHGEGLLGRNACLFKHVHAVIFGDDDFGHVFLFTTVERIPYLAPIAAC